MKILGINHIGLAPKDPEKARWFFKEIMGLRDEGSELISEQSTQTHIFAPREEVAPGAQLLEVLENEAGKEGPIKNFLKKKGSGIHHVALEVDDLAAALQYLSRMGIQMIDESPRRGVCNTSIAFVHPNATGGLLVELVQQDQV